MTLLSIDWSGFFVKAGQFILSFSILVVLHEMGHFLPARWFKCRVEKFYLFFNPWFSLVKKKIGETEYGLGWVPFGGYVKISGMVDESMDKEQMKLPPQPYEFRSKKPWQRLIIMLGGIIVNLLLGFFIYAMMLWHWGEQYVPVNKMTYGITTDSLAQSIGLKNGDKITGLDGKYVEKFSKVPVMVILNDIKTININRDGKEMNIDVPKEFAGNLISHKDIGFIDVRVPIGGIDEVADTSAAQKAGLKVGDKVIAINGNSLAYFDEFKAQVQQNKNKQIDVVYLRKNDTLKTSLTVPATGAIGINNGAVKKYIEVKEVSYNFFSCFGAGLRKSGETIQSYWLQLKLMFNGKVKTSESLGSVISIGKMYSSEWDWQNFWALTAFFSLVLAFMNLLPIPALDGGHALFTIIEMITGRKPSDKFMEYAQTVGMVLLLGLMVYALGLDFWRIFK